MRAKGTSRGIEELEVELRLNAASGSVGWPGRVLFYNYNYDYLIQRSRLYNRSESQLQTITCREDDSNMVSFMYIATLSRRS